MTNFFYFRTINNSYQYYLIILFSEDTENNATDTIFDEEAGPSTSSLGGTYWFIIMYDYIILNSDEEFRIR